MSEKTVILLVDSDEDLHQQLLEAFRGKEIELLYTNSGEQAIQWFPVHLPDVVLINLILPDMEGLELTNLLSDRESLHRAHLIVLSDHPEEYTEIAAFRHGADDFVRKPVRIRAFVKRILAAKKRYVSQVRLPTLEVFDGFVIDPNQFLVFQAGETHALPRKEFQLLYYLAQHPRRIFSREELLQQVWESDVLVVARTVDVHILKIRNKIGSGHIQTVKGKGYRFVPQPVTIPA